MSSNLAFKETKYSQFSGKSSKKNDENQNDNSVIYELQEVKEQTIYEEEMMEELIPNSKQIVK